MKPLDLIIIFGYLVGIVLFGTWFGRRQKTTSDYFLGDRSVPDRKSTRLNSSHRT